MARCVVTLPALAPPAGGPGSASPAAGAPTAPHRQRKCGDVRPERDSYAYAKKARADAAAASAVLRREAAVLLTNVRVVDVDAATTSLPTSVLILNGKILAVGADEVTPLLSSLHTQAQAQAQGAAGAGPGASSSPVEYVEVDCGGRVLIPGLCDAHVHCTATSANLSSLLALPESYVAAKATHILEGMLCRGFTTVRDAGGADFGLAQAVEEGLVLGPRLLFTGHALSQTGGHGDFRSRGEDCFACGAALRGIGRVCDGDAEVRRAARDELRKGAHCIKIMASGGVASPTDKLTSNQFSEGEMFAIVEEAQAVGSYVCAHAYMPSAIERAVMCGARSIEHGNFLDEPTARLMSQHRTYLVPTLVTYHMLAERGREAGMAPELVAKVGDCLTQGLHSLQLAQSHNIIMCFGSDLLGDLHQYQSKEFGLRAQVLPVAEVLRSATLHAAHLFGLQMSIGQIQAGYAADLVMLEGDPFLDAGVLAEPDVHVVFVMKEGLMAATRQGLGLEAINMELAG